MIVLGADPLVVESNAGAIVKLSAPPFPSVITSVNVRLVRVKLPVFLTLMVYFIISSAPIKPSPSSVLIEATLVTSSEGDATTVVVTVFEVSDTVPFDAVATFTSPPLSITV